MIRSTGREAAPIQCAVGVLGIAVQAYLILGLILLRYQVEHQLIGLPRLRGEAGVHIELGFPDAPVFVRGRCLVDVHHSAVGILVQTDQIAVIVALIDAVDAAVCEITHGQTDRGFRHCLGDHLAGGLFLIQGKAVGQDIGVVVRDFLHPEIAHGHRGALGHLAQGELDDQLLALAAAGDHSLTAGDLIGHQVLAIEGAVALFHIGVVKEHLKGHVLIAHHIGGDVITGAGIGDEAGLDIEPGLPDAGIPGRSHILQRHRVGVALEEHAIALVVLFIDPGLIFKVHGHGQGVLVVHLVRVFLHLDLGEVNGKRREHAQLQIQIAGAALGDQNAGDRVVALFDVKLLEIAELDLAGHVGGEAVGHPVIPTGHGGIVALQLHMPGLAVGLGGGEAVDPVHHLARTDHGVALKLGLEGRVAGVGRAGRQAFGVEDGRALLRDGGGRLCGRRLLRRGRLGRRGGRFRRSRGRRRGLAAARKQKRGEQQYDDETLCLLHRDFLLAE